MVCDKFEYYINVSFLARRGTVVVDLWRASKTPRKKAGGPGVCGDPWLHPRQAKARMEGERSNAFLYKDVEVLHGPGNNHGTRRRSCKYPLYVSGTGWCRLLFGSLDRGITECATGTKHLNLPKPMTKLLVPELSWNWESLEVVKMGLVKTLKFYNFRWQHDLSRTNLKTVFINCRST